MALPQSPGVMPGKEEGMEEKFTKEWILQNLPGQYEGGDDLDRSIAKIAAFLECDPDEVFERVQGTQDILKLHPMVLFQLLEFGTILTWVA